MRKTVKTLKTLKTLSKNKIVTIIVVFIAMALGVLVLNFLTKGFLKEGFQDCKIYTNCTYMEQNDGNITGECNENGGSCKSYRSGRRGQQKKKKNIFTKIRNLLGRS